MITVYYNNEEFKVENGWRIFSSFCEEVVVEDVEEGRREEEEMVEEVEEEEDQGVGRISKSTSISESEGNMMGRINSWVKG